MLNHPPLTSCYAARFLTGQRPPLVHGPGVGDPCFSRNKRKTIFEKAQINRRKCLAEVQKFMMDNIFYFGFQNLSEEREFPLCVFFIANYFVRFM